jgi:predicted DCC family thiol-disulfide oxidoreductase YuxK
MKIILFDGLCNLCNGTVSILIHYDTRKQFLFAAQQSNAGKNLIEKHNIPDDLKSIILIKDDFFFYKSDAVIEIAKLITGWPSLLKYGSIFPKSFRNWVYKVIANNRYRIFGKKDKCVIPSKENLTRFLV